MYLGQVQVVLDNFGTFIYKYVDALLFVSGQKKTQGLLEKEVFKVVSLNKVVTPEKIQSSTKGFNSRYFNNIKDLCIDKACEKCCLVIYTYNDKKKNIVLKHLSKFQEVSQGISFYFATIIWDNDNHNIRFYLQDITQAYIEIAFAIYYLYYKEKSKISKSAHDY